MGWTKPKGYSRSKVDWAGNILISEASSAEDKEKALEILDNWRAIHRYPMHIFKKRLKRVSEKMDNEALSVQRLKRLPSILKKLQRRYYGNKPTMKLSQMQDVAGCRVVMPNVELARKLHKEEYIRGDLKHKKVNEKDYITTPKEDGYRSIHLMYKYKSDKKGKKDYNGLLVEVQIRSKLQHLWATAIETVDFFTRQAIKSNEGQKEWVDFFKLVSSAFAKMEDCPCVPGTPYEEQELFAQIRKKEADLNVVKIMRGWAKAIRVFEREMIKKYNWKFFLLELDISKENLNISAYTQADEKEAIKDYSKAEKRNVGKREYDVVLVGADTTSDLKKAYPNYFVDTGEFLQYLEKILNRN
ncbi:MAG TPA: (p)ppGpp synthetase [Candidatus Pacearchaeota archaeon]|nr:GTP pyrophosphokinase YjbM [archaeon BMS3Abin17]HDK42563.1 (p)ppGpp synthetase [Candidatus Pacearchaeota archaeon]HDZ61012.1 (p)ppGpp synthetase [Candidatus Pacearchaeota archaeon]